MAQHVVQPRTYLVVFAALMGLLFVTVRVASYDIGRLNLPVALAVAIAKAALIVMYFMQVRYSRPLIALAATGALLWLVILIGMTFDDFLTR